MTRVCLVGTDDCDLRYELLSRETSRDALATYRLDQPFVNTVAVETISLGSAVALLNDLNWYLVRFVDQAMVLEPSVSEHEWLSRNLARAVREGAMAPDDTDRYLNVYGVEETEAGPRLVEPMYVTRTGPTLPEYDLRDVDETVIVRLTEDEFEG